MRAPMPSRLPVTGSVVIWYWNGNCVSVKTPSEFDQREALVEAGHAGAAGLDERGVEHLAALLVDGEAVVDDLPQRAPVCDTPYM